MTTPEDGRTPSAPDGDEPEGATHHGENEQAASGRTPRSPGIDEPETTSAE